MYRIRKGEILEAEHVIHGQMKGNYRTQGEIKEISLIIENDY